MNQQTISFWDTIIGKSIRWILFIPVGLISVAIADWIIEITYIWLASLDTTWLLIVLFMGGGVLVMVFCLVYLAAVATMAIVPHKKAGMITMGIVYILVKVLIIYHIIAMGNTVIPSVIFVIIQLIETSVYLGGLYASSENRENYI